MFRRKAFLHWYTGEGMDEMEFTEAESNMNGKFFLKNNWITNWKQMSFIFIWQGFETKKNAHL